MGCQFCIHLQTVVVLSADEPDLSLLVSFEPFLVLLGELFWLPCDSVAFPLCAPSVLLSPVEEDPPSFESIAFVNALPMVDLLVLSALYRLQSPRGGTPNSATVTLIVVMLPPVATPAGDTE